MNQKKSAPTSGAPKNRIFINISVLNIYFKLECPDILNDY